MIEDTLKDLAAALRENTEALKAQSAKPTGQSAKETPKTEAPAKSKKQSAAAKFAEQDAAEAAAAAEAETETPTKVETPKAAADDTPHVASTAPTEDGQPAAAEYVDVDETIGKINTIVKSKLMASDDVPAAKKRWATIREGYGVDRISDLRGNPEALLKALAQAEAL